MKTVTVTEKFNDEGRLIERVTETVETIEAAPFNNPWTYPTIAPVPYQPIIISQPHTTPMQPQITWTTGGNICGGMQ